MPNFSRRILAWTVDAKVTPASTCRILVAAVKNLVPAPKETEVFMDGGGENVNSEVDRLLGAANGSCQGIEQGDKDGSHAPVSVIRSIGPLSGVFVHKYSPL
jgi:hypothetical protein